MDYQRSKEIGIRQKLEKIDEYLISSTEEELVFIYLCLVNFSVDERQLNFVIRLHEYYRKNRNES